MVKRQVLEGGLKVTTTLDRRAQRVAEEAIATAKESIWLATTLTMPLLSRSIRAMAKS